MSKAIDSTLAAYQSSYNRIIEYQWPNIKEHINGVQIHHATYSNEKLYGLPTALICSARVRATETLKSVQTSLKKRLLKDPTVKFNQPLAKKPIPIRYNNTCMVVQLTENWVIFL